MKKSSVIGIVVVMIVVLGLGAFALSGQKSNKDTAANNKASTTTAAPNTVIIDNLDFQQKEITVKKGSTVTWKNMDTAKHNIIFDNKTVGAVEDNKLIGAGEELRFIFNTAGEFSYFCEPHPFMKAKIIVTE